ncbi:MAG: hypothetical protein HY290_25200 [Planctomycetia bacterium]|nr:hypothetical protein [Planctomycetia bacterium]
MTSRVNSMRNSDSHRLLLCLAAMASILDFSRSGLMAQTAGKADGAAGKSPGPALVIQAAIDGRDELRISRNGLEWMHHDWGWPSGVTINGKSWNPEQQPKLAAAELEKFPAADVKFAHPELVVRKGRGKVTWRRESADSIIVEFNDGEVGADVYDVTVRFRDLSHLATGAPQVPDVVAGAPASGDLRITATIDGSEELRIYRDRAEWKHTFGERATEIKFNGAPWDPQRTPRIDNAGATVFLPESALLFGMTHWTIRGRGKVETVVYPDFVLVQIWDPDPGAGVYDIVLRPGEPFSKVSVSGEDRRHIARLVRRGAAVPHPRDRQVPTHADFDEARRAWRRSRLVWAYHRHGHRDPSWDAAAHDYLSRCAQIPEEPPAALIEAGDALIDLGCDDPLVCFSQAWQLWRAGQPSRAEPYALHAVLKFEGSAFPKRATRLAPALLARVMLDQSTEKSDTAYGLLRRALAETVETAARGMSPIDSRALLDELRSDLSTTQKGVLANHRGALCRLLADSKDPDPFILNHVLATYQHDQAWQARGGGYADTVTEVGFEVFHKVLAQSQARWIAAWRMHPYFPEAAVDLIMVVRALPAVAGESPRFWFDQAVAAEIDASHAHRLLMFALRPRWGGSHIEMLMFGLECLGTGRFDTRVPETFHKAVLDIAEENANARPLIDAMQAGDAIRESLAVAEREAAPDQLRRTQTLNLVTTWKLGWRDEARRRFDDLKGSPDAEVIAAYKIDAAMLNLDVGNPPHAAQDAPTLKADGTRFQRRGAILAFDVSRSGDHVAVGTKSKERPLTLWNTADGKPKSLKVQSEEPITALRLSPDSRWLAGLAHRRLPSEPEGAPLSGALALWQLFDGPPRPRPPVIANSLNSVAWFSDGKHLAGAFYNNGGIWDFESGELVASTPFGSAFVRSIAVAPNGRLLALGQQDAVIQLFRVPFWQPGKRGGRPITMEVAATFKTCLGVVESLQFSPDGTLLASGSETDGTVWLFDAGTGVPKNRVEGRRLSFSPDGKRLATTGGNLPAGQAALWDVKSGDAILRCVLPGKGSLGDPAFLSGGNVLLAPDKGGSIYAWKLDGAK